MSDLGSAQWQLISPYLDQALEMSGEERAAWLSVLRSDDPSLASQLEALLNEHRSNSEDDFLHPHTIVLSGSGGLAGHTLGPYRLLSPLEQGGMGSVWLAERSDGRFERRVAVKFLHIALMGKGGEARFLREGRILARLTHQHIAGLLDSGVTPAGQPYLVIEYVQGESIDVYCNRRLLDVRSRIRLFLEVLAAVAHAHNTMVVHRDIKPSNVLVRSDGVVKLLDFGIAKLLADGDDNAGNTLLTTGGMLPMTPSYAAPEQLLGEAITTATDVYSLGVLLYLLLTGQHPVGSHPQSPADLVKAVVDDEPLRPSAIVAQTDSNTPVTAPCAALRCTTPDKLSRILRGDLDLILTKALKKNPAERYDSVAAFAEDLRRYLRSEPVHARPDTFVYRATKFARRHRKAVVLATLAIMAIAGGFIGTLVETRTARAQCRFAVQQLRRKQALAELTQFLLSDAAPAGKPLTVNELLGRAEELLSRQHANDDENRVELLVSIGDQYSTQDEDEKARRVLERAYSLSKSLPGGGTRAEAACALAGALARDGDLSRAEALYGEGMQEIPKSSDYDQERIFCLRRGSEVAQQRGDAEEGIRRMKSAQQVLTSSVFQSNVLQFEISLDLAEAYRMAGQNQQAVFRFEEAYALLLSLGRDNTHSAVVVFNDWGLALSRLGRQLEAERLLRRAISVSRAGNGTETVSPMVLKNYAAVLRELGRIDGAADYAARAYANAKRVDNHLAIYQTEYLLAIIYVDQGNINKATEMLAKVKPLLRRSLPSDSMWFGALASVQGLVAARAGHLQKAVEFENRSIAVIEAAMQKGRQGADFLPIALLRRSSVRMQAGDYEGAGADAERAANLLKKAIPQGAFSSYLGQAYMAHALAMQAEGLGYEAQLDIRTATEHFRNTLGSDYNDRSSKHQAIARIPQRHASPRT